MEKHSWQKVAYRKNGVQPGPRWGHAAALVGEELVLFGGYADSQYMNDIWCFNTREMAWSECKTTGTAPDPRSNSTIHYDSKNNRVVLFGGGGHNKLRYNDVFVLDWQTKAWSLLVPAQSEKNPWERTYHSSEILYPYLLIFGGEGIADLDDLWAFNLQTKKWTELSTDSNEQGPCARRFHSSVVIGTTFYVIAGCRDKYRCLCDIFTIDLSSFITSGDTNGLVWKQLKIKNSSFLTRWGHTSSVFEEKVYIFGGRFSSDLQDILVVDPCKETIKAMKVHGDLPKPRRRHSSTFIGSSLLVFGGFNGQYFNDLNYINVFELGSRSQSLAQPLIENKVNWINNHQLYDWAIKTKDGKPFYIHKGLIADKFKYEEQLPSFLEFIEGHYDLEELTEIFEILYDGVGVIREELLLQSFSFNLHETDFEKEASFRKGINPQALESGSLLSKVKLTSRVIPVQAQAYCEYVQSYRSSKYHDLTIILNEQYYLPANRVILAVNSTFFEYLFTHDSSSHIRINLEETLGDVRVFQVMLNYLQSEYLVLPKDLDENCWINLLQLAHYFCLENLIRMCEIELISKIDMKNCETLLEFSIAYRLDVLSACSGEFLFKHLLEEGEIALQGKREASNEREKIINHYTSQFQFYLLQLQLQKKGSQQLLKGQPSEAIEKENHETLIN